MSLMRNARIRIDEVALPGNTLSLCVPLTPNRCWLTSLSTLIGPMAREEARRVLKGPERAGLLLLSHLFETIGHALRIDQAVYPEHDLLSTSLYGSRLPLILSALPELKRLYSAHALIIRSQTEPIYEGVVWPFRLIWHIEDVSAEWLPRRDSQRDIHRLEALGLTPQRYEADMDDAKLERCLDLYRTLYIDTYSAFNPDYTAQGLRHLMHKGGVVLHTLENDAGDIEAVCAAKDDGESLILPLVGYNPGRPQSDGLYRAIMAHMALDAMKRGLKLNLSAGAPHFKRHRGARPCLEYLIIIDDHLPMWRRMGYRLIAQVLKTMAPRLHALAQR
ncbi:MAG: GNAT family N-acetyltransferase [Asticcacaulis sp.]